MKLDILIPMYNEDASVVKPLLDSIAIQQNVDFGSIGAIICIDGGTTEIPEDFIKRYPFHIEVHHEPHRGVSGTRNACLDYSKADYVMFCDCDTGIKYPVEEWKEVSGYEGLYKISTYGRVYSYPRTKTNGGIIRQSFSNSGYLQVHLCKNGRCKTFLTHRLVATHFIDNPNNYPVINHKDEDKTNNCIWNLEHCTRTYNQNYGTAIERSVKGHDYKTSARKSADNHDYDAISMKTSKPLLQLDLFGNIVKRWRGVQTACKSLNISSGNISKACKMNTVAYGYRWVYE